VNIFTINQMYVISDNTHINRAYIKKQFSLEKLALDIFNRSSRNYHE